MLLLCFLSLLDWFKSCWYGYAMCFVAELKIAINQIYKVAFFSTPRCSYLLSIKHKLNAYTKVLRCCGIGT